MGEVVGLDPAKLQLLEGELRRAATRLATAIPVVRRALLEGELDPVGARPLLEVQTWLDEQAARLRAMRATVLAWEHVGRAVPWGPEVWHHPSHPSHAAPGRAWAAAMAVQAALAEGRSQAAFELVQRWHDDPLFAAVVGPILDADLLAEQLDLLDGLLAYPDGAPERARQEEIVRALASTLAGMSTLGVAPVDLSAVARALEARGAPRRALALLFREPLAWDSRVLVDAVTHVVVPINRQLLGGDGPDRAYVPVGDDLVDARVLVLRALASDGRAALEVLRTVDLDELAGADVAYLDGGSALGEAVAAASIAALADPAPLLRFIEWVGPERALGPGLVDQLGRIVAPHLGALRPDRLDASPGAGVVANSLPGLGEADARDYLDTLARSRRATDDLRAALVSWTAGQLDLLFRDGPPPSGALQQVGAVYRFVSDGGRRFDQLRGRTVDTSRERTREGLALVALVWSSFAPKPWSGLYRSVQSASFIDDHWPQRRAELEQLRHLADDIRDDQEELEWQVLARAWRHRGLNPSWSAAPAPPPALLAADGTLRPLGELDDGARAQFRRWRDHPAVQAASGLNDAAAAYGR